ncbi:hypothetical protein KDW_61600 [Dictyobacter vulcani]|uniref:Uncharacterized protein n=1 Tax=Dictyobacter vulcani TaxID=2607529 RepID=A0A5J4KQM2_9CHLR|nr:hypothetical protein [Dictyobacter vulcani]GER91998.1 hypothetical protein KDW_61600 [Dictyobacter vulcani]
MAAENETPAHHLPEQVAQQPGDAKKSDTTNVTPWLGFEGHDGSNVTPWLGLEKYDLPDAFPVSTQEQRETEVNTSQDEGEAAAEKSSEPAAGRKADSPIPGKPTSGPISNPGVSNGSRRLGGARTTRKNGEALPTNIAWPEPMTHTATADNKPGARQNAVQTDFPILPSTPPPAAIYM